MSSLNRSSASMREQSKEQSPHLPHKTTTSTDTASRSDQDELNEIGNCDGDKGSQIISRPLLKLKLLDSLRQGNFENLKQLIHGQFQPADDPNVKAVRSLTLHYAVQVAPLSLIKEIVQEWCKDNQKDAGDLDVCLDINQTDENGNTPLHLAAFQTRGDVVAFLMDQPNINDCVLNNSHLQPIEVCKNLNIAQMMQVKRASYVAETAQEFRTAFNNRDFSHLESILSAPRNAELLDINGMDPETGDTVLHEFVKKRDVIMCRWLLEHGADPFKRDRQGRLPIDLVGKVSESSTATNTKAAIEVELKKLLSKAAKEQSAIDVTNNLNEPPTYKGYLKKWTNFAQGYKLRWFILSKDGKLSYFKDQSDTRNACRGSLNMSSCYLHLDSSEKLKFEIIGGSDGTIRWHLKANHPIETNRWVWAIQGAIRFSKDREMMTKSGNIPPSLAMSRGASSSTTVQKLHSYESQRHSSQLHLTHDRREPSADHPQAKQHNRIPSSSSSRGKLSSTPSIASSDMGLSDNLTESGKMYVNKILENRLESTSRASSIKNFGAEFPNKEAYVASVHSSSKSNVVDANGNEALPGNRSITGSELNYVDDQTASVDFGTVSDDAEDNEEVTKEDDEDVAVQYGPYAEKLAILQRTISMDLASLTELLDSGIPGKEEWEIIRRSLASVLGTFEKLNSLTSARDKKLVMMLSKQRDVNNVWIQSVKDLEIELIEKSNRLASLDKERKNLKKLLQKGLLDAGEASNTSLYNLNLNGPNATEETPNALDQIAKFIDATKDEDAGSEADEFFDAEELVEASNIEQELIEPVENEVTESKAALRKGKEMVTEVHPVKEDKLPSYDEAERIPSEEVTKPGATKEKTLPKEKEGNIFAIVKTAGQTKKARLMMEEGSYLGYEDGVRNRLKLDKDDRPSIGLWSVLKSMVGKDMTRMTLPVTFNEPTSLLQRVAEDLEYINLLDEAASFEDSTLRLLYIGVFTASSYASTIKRVAKPFNPLLGETFEYARPDKHYRFFTEQVSHHPPISATWTESPKWDFWGESNVDSKFNGRSFAFRHLGLWYIKMRPDNQSPDEIYTWKKPNNTVIGILVGNPQVDNHGDVKIVNHTTGDYCMLNFKARGWRSSGAYEVRGEVFNKQGKKMWVLGGHWNDSIYGKKVTSNDNDDFALQKTITTSSPATAGPNFDGSKFLIWKVHPRPDAPFNLTPFAITLNAPQPKLLPWLAPTDTRLRPDQRSMEEGRYDEAGEEKHRLEEKQRAARKRREAAKEQYHPRWFVKEIHPITKSPYWRFKGDYWNLRKQHKLDNCEDIF
ncbi:hypothetical protein HG536_0G02760 [Torulaspora globosa]|uniref:PH domain-containing protein n=1 Tax=Torulaspora globosa TaxID=48254 RepID=A0A7G3ZLM9_9SACH|nr:uncharacterized protein HG536_0G02760 [Torulaspora globosa]QLL34415.1 hypothetical protein HG536_0G02760 [Torulaspora globosa]